MYYTPFLSKIEVEPYQPKYRGNYVSVVTNDNDTEEEVIDLPTLPFVSPEVADVVIEDNDYTFSGNKEEYKKKMLPLYEAELIRRGLNPEYAKYLVAQDGLESAWGSKKAGKNNFGGIKVVGNSNGTLRSTHEWDGSKMKSTTAKFQDFKNLKEYVKYKVGMLNGKKYNAFSGPVPEFFNRVKAGGYATDPSYVKKLNRVLVTMKKGGILKCEGGDSTKWLISYYNNRKPQLGANANLKIIPETVIGGARARNIHNRLKLNDWDLDGKSLEEKLKVLNLHDQYKVVDQYMNQYGIEGDSTKLYNDFMNFRKWVNDNKGITPDHMWNPEELDQLKPEYPNFNNIDTKVLTEMLNNVASTKRLGKSFI